MMEASEYHNFMEEVSILTISMFFIIIYSIMCIYFNILFYDVLKSLHPYRKTSTSIDASMYISTTDATIEETSSFSVLHTQVCVKFDKFTTLISLFYEILKYNVVVLLKVVLPYGDEKCPST
jgi:hypothetical protein